jgi:predicted amidohydrolase
VSRQLGIGLAQLVATPYTVGDNKVRAADAVISAFAGGANLVVLPEMMVPGYVVDRQRLLAVAEPVPGPSTDEWGELAAQGSGFVVGGLCERDEDRLFNTAVVVGPDGRLLGHYRKTHLFGEEKRVFAPGDLGFPLVKTEFGTIGLCVCYDLRFVEVVRLMALQGAELICVPTAWIVGFDEIRWDSEGMSPQGRVAEVQANLNQVYLAAASQVGSHNGYEFLGSSILIDPWGRRALGPLPGQEEELAVATIDLDEASRAQTRSELVTPRADRRTDIYRLAVDRRLL